MSADNHVIFAVMQTYSRLNDGGKKGQSFLSVNYTRLNPCRNISALDHCNCMRTDGPTRDVRGGNKELWRRFRHPGHIHVYRAAIAAPDAVINIIKGAG